ncbi:MAG: DUF6807 family protein [Planctomycetales bacterium]
MNRRLGIAISAFLVLSVAVANDDSMAAEEPQPSGGPFAIERGDEGVLVTEDGKPVLFHQQRPKSAGGRYTRANYVHPLYDLAGDVLTEDFPPDHLHQRGIYWAWHQLWVGEKRIGDPWAAQDFLAEVRSIDVKSQDDQSIALEAHAVWMSPRFAAADGTPRNIVDERTTVRVHRRADDRRAIDFEIRLRALHPDVRIGGSEDEKGYGGFSARIKLPRDVKFTGPRGPIEPQLTAIDAGPWIDISTKDGGLAVLSHPSNPEHPPGWILRSEKSMQNPAWPGREPVAVSQDENKPLTLRYRLVLHRGPLARAALDRLHAEYAK